ncbi:hypothetical protein OH77DRAFT_1525665 [Trametes cingulata]|nr:hypothetical protein OH77DRAFT_1525665 [Trametes cingulata]
MGYLVFNPKLLTFGRSASDVPSVQLQYWPLDRQTGRSLTAFQRSQELTYSVPHYLAYETLFYMRSQLSQFKNDIWSAATGLDAQLRLLACIAVRSCVDDTRELVQRQVVAEIKPVLVDNNSDDYPHAHARHQALKSWLKQPYPLDRDFI